MLKIGYKFWIRLEYKHCEAEISGIAKVETLNENYTAYLVDYRDEQGGSCQILRRGDWILSKIRR